MQTPRLLIVGWLNSPHVVSWAESMAERGYEVHLTGQYVDGWSRDTPATIASVAELPQLGPPGFTARRLVPRLAAIAERIDPTIVHAHWVTSFGWIAAKAGLRPLVVSAWGSDLLRAGPLLQRRNRTALRAADLVLADSAHLARAAAAIAGDGTPVEVVNWGVDLDTLTPAADGERARLRAELDLGDGPVVLSTRDLKPLYNIPLLLDAFARVRRDVPAAQLVLKHPHPDVPAEIAAQIKRAGIADSVIVIGRTELEHLIRLYRAADVLVSIPDTDSSPRTVWEALACGCPVVVSDLPWARDALDAGGVLVPVDPTAVADAIAPLVRDPAAARRLGAAGRRLAEDAMNRRAEMDRADRLYRSVLG